MTSLLSGIFAVLVSAGAGFEPADPADPADPAESYTNPEANPEADPEADPETDPLGSYTAADPEAEPQSEFEATDESTDPGLAAEQDMTFESVSPARPHFVFLNTYGLTYGINRFGSFDSTFFFGAALRRRTTKARRWALGYQLTLSAGGAERYILGLFVLRHHLAAYTYSPSKRLFASASAGVAFFLGLLPAVLEAEGRLGFVFGRRRKEQRIAGIAGAKLRMGWHFHNDELIPMPQIGAFIGFAAR